MSVFSYKLRYIIAFWLVEITNQKPTIYCNLYENISLAYYEQYYEEWSIPDIWSFIAKALCFNPLSLHDTLKHHFTSLRTNFQNNIFMKVVYQYMAIFLNFQTTSNHLHSLQVENCDSNSRLVVHEDDNGKFRIERINIVCISIFIFSGSIVLPDFYSCHGRWRLVVPNVWHLLRNVLYQQRVHVRFC